MANLKIGIWNTVFGYGIFYSNHYPDMHDYQLSGPFEVFVQEINSLVKKENQNNITIGA